jgi:hypothetical protein
VARTCPSSLLQKHNVGRATGSSCVGRRRRLDHGVVARQPINVLGTLAGLPVAVARREISLPGAIRELADPLSHVWGLDFSGRRTNNG